MTRRRRSPDEERAALTAAWRVVRDTTSPRATWALALELLVWWLEAGRVFYGKGVVEGVSNSGCYFQPDEGLRSLVVDAVRALGGWRVARALADVSMGRDREPRKSRDAARGIFLREETER